MYKIIHIGFDWNGRNYIQAELAAIVLELSSKQTDILAIK